MSTDTPSISQLPPILVLSPHTLKTVDPDAESLFSLWTVFSKCKNSIENGRRLENMSWRLWNRERLWNSDGGLDIDTGDLVSIPGAGSGKTQNSSQVSAAKVENGIISTLGAANSTTSGKENSRTSHRVSTTKPDLTLMAAVDNPSPSLHDLPALSPTHSPTNLNHNHHHPHKHISSEELQHLFQLVNSDQKTPSKWGTCSKQQLKPSSQSECILTDGELTPTPNSILDSKLVASSIGPAVATAAAKAAARSVTNMTNISPASSTTPITSTESNNAPRLSAPNSSIPTSRELGVGSSSGSLTAPSTTASSSILANNSGTTTPLLRSAKTTPAPSRTVSSLFSRPKTTNYASSTLQENKRPVTELPLPVPTKPTASATFFARNSRRSSSSQSNPFSHSRTAQRRSFTTAPASGVGAPAAPTAPPAPGHTLSSVSKTSRQSRSSSSNVMAASISPHSDYSQAISDSSDDLSDTESDSDDERLSRRHRSATSTSIVRGFSPSNISISVVNRSASQKRISPVPTTSSSSWKPTKARPDKLPREKMFFIESSPSDSEFGGESLSSSEGSGAPSNGAAPPKPYNLADAIGGERSPQPLEESSTAKARDESVSETNNSGSSGSNSVVSQQRQHGHHHHHHHHHNHREERKRSSLFGHTKSQPALSKLAAPPVSKLQQLHKPTIKNDGLTDEQKKINAEKAIITDDEDDEDEDEDDIHDDDDEDDSAWDSVDDESDSSFDEESLFVREEELPKKPLVRPSLLSSLFLNRQDILQEQMNAKQRESSPFAPATAPGPSSSALTNELKANRGNPTRNGPTALPINPTDTILNATIATHIPPPGALSPRTTRRNMLSTELSESLRRNLLWERQQNGVPSLGINGANNSTSTMVPSAESSGATSPTGTNPGLLRRSHTSTGVMTMNSLGLNNPSSNPPTPDVEAWKEEMDDQNVDFNYHARGW
ncbi:hypothetical protein AWJ20_4493 [Sugiyamaella lignohabitans]|uniref:Uncharacterized protein n=1 Tax=Sugiyamaella lignohabitans TaxID=796027 RepID=A0A167CGR1_9ASCO|nr:uncharacterized protein AWJ20_4493 [Sugiyamaella lignohabitans]ANB11672.1 hypothetical protein AWJ20_4493 [Sugiyamaella lignohabitans]